MMGIIETAASPEHAFDLELSSPVRLDERPEHGWCFGRPPGIGPERWPISPVHGTPLRHAFTLKLPETYRTKGPDLVAISLFVDEMFRERDVEALSASDVLPRETRKADERRFDMEWFGYHLTLFWLSTEEFEGELGAPPKPGSEAAARALGWLTDPPSVYFGRYNLPSSAFRRPPASSSAPGAFALQMLMESEQPPSGWATLPGTEAMDHGFPIRVRIREGDPNVGRSPSEDKDKNARSGYVPIYSDAEGAADLERFAEFDAHLGGTMLPMQEYPDVSPFYLEFQDTFGGFAFGGGTAQLDLQNMRITWAS